MNKLKLLSTALVMYATAIFAPVKASADDIYKGVRGPTNWQLDERIAYSRNEKNAEAVTNNIILKYWDGDEFGKFGFISLPYKSIDSNNLSENGIGDISIGLGPRGRIGNLHWMLPLTSTFPTGNNGLGNERYDLKTIILATYLTSDKKYELDWISEYAFTGENKKDINPSNEIYIGLLAGRKITDKIRFATGFTDLNKEGGDFLVNSRSVMRYTVSKELHFELVWAIGVDNKNIPKDNTVILQARYNFEIKK